MMPRDKIAFTGMFLQGSSVRECANFYGVTMFTAEATLREAFAQLVKLVPTTKPEPDAPAPTLTETA